MVIGPLETNFSEIVLMQQNVFENMVCKMGVFCFGLNVLMKSSSKNPYAINVWH